MENHHIYWIIQRFLTGNFQRRELLVYQRVSGRIPRGYPADIGQLAMQVVPVILDV
jgi:hypothetical protein